MPTKSERLVEAAAKFRAQGYTWEILADKVVVYKDGRWIDTVDLRGLK